MKKGFCRRVILRYLFILAILMFIPFAIGCHGKLPVIKVAPVADSLTVEKYQAQPIFVGHFTAGSAEHDKYADFIGSYLAKGLEKKELASSSATIPTPPKAEKPALVINGNVVFIHIPAPDDSSRIVWKIDTTFHLTDRTIGNVIQSTILSKITSQLDEDHIHHVLRACVDSYLSEIYPANFPISVRMARGGTDYDRQGMRLASEGDYTGALEYFRLAIDAQPDDDGALFNAGLMCEYLCDFERAGKFYRRALALMDKPDYNNACERIDRRLSLR